MRPSYWHDDCGDGLSYSLYESKEAYQDMAAELYGQLDYMLDTRTMKRKWRAIAFQKHDTYAQDWFTDKNLAFRFVEREITY